MKHLTMLFYHYLAEKLIKSNKTESFIFSQYGKYDIGISDF